jgi:hypothetical protein
MGRITIVSIIKETLGEGMRKRGEAGSAERERERERDVCKRSVGWINQVSQMHQVGFGTLRRMRCKAQPETTMGCLGSQWLSAVLRI